MPNATKRVINQHKKDLSTELILTNYFIGLFGAVIGGTILIGYAFALESIGNLICFFAGAVVIVIIGAVILLVMIKLASPPS